MYVNWKKKNPVGNIISTATLIYVEVYFIFQITRNPYYYGLDT